MSEIRTEESQQELFPGFSKQKKDPDRLPPWVGGAPKPILISATAEQIFLTVIVLILAACFVFFLGFLRAKSIYLKPRVVQAAVRRPAPREIAAMLPAPAIAAPPARPAPDVGPKPYTIQLMTTKKKDLAEREARDLQARGFFTMIMKSGDSYQVCAGQYATKEDAKKDLAFFESRYKGSYLRRR